MKDRRLSSIEAHAISQLVLAIAIKVLKIIVHSRRRETGV